MDKIIIKGLTLFAYHGVNPEEKEFGQNFVLDLECYADISAACRSDALDDTVSYAKIIKTVRAAFTQQSDDLLERAAQRVCDAVFEEFDKIQSVRVCLKKPDAPIKADFDFVGVEIFRERSGRV